MTAAVFVIIVLRDNCQRTCAGKIYLNALLRCYRNEFCIAFIGAEVIYLCDRVWIDERNARCGLGIGANT